MYSRPFFTIDKVNSELKKLRMRSVTKLPANCLFVSVDKKITTGKESEKWRCDFETAEQK